MSKLLYHRQCLTNLKEIYLDEFVLCIFFLIVLVDMFSHLSSILLFGVCTHD